jgi:hypothetical protein
MTRSQLDQLCQNHGVKVDDVHQGPGKFADLFIGTGAPVSTLDNLKKAIISTQGFGGEIRPVNMGTIFNPQYQDINLIRIDRVDNPEHPDFGKPFLMVGSFWNE